MSLFPTRPPNWKLGAQPPDPPAWPRGLFRRRRSDKAGVFVPTRPPIGSWGLRPQTPVREGRTPLDSPWKPFTMPGVFRARMVAMGQSVLGSHLPAHWKLGAAPPDPRARGANASGLSLEAIHDAGGLPRPHGCDGSECSWFPPARPLEAGGCAPRPPCRSGKTPLGLPSDLTESEQFREGAGTQSSRDTVGAAAANLPAGVRRDWAGRQLQHLRATTQRPENWLLTSAEPVDMLSLLLKGTTEFQASSNDTNSQEWTWGTTPQHHGGTGEPWL